MIAFNYFGVVFVLVIFYNPCSGQLTSQGEDDFKCPGEQGYYPHPENCEKYYGCWEHQSTSYKCPQQQLFDMKYRGCNWPELTDCQDRTRPPGYPNTKTPPPSSGSSTEKPFDCPGEQGYYPHPEKCEMYYGCWEHQSTSYKCPQQQLFDMKYRGCNWPELTDCQDRTRPSGYPNTKTPPPSSGGTVTSKPIDCPIEVEDGYYADPADCHSYYRCVRGNSYHYNCAPPLVFDDIRKACDYQANVDCGSRPK